MSAETLAALPPWAAALLDELRVGHLGLLDERAHPRVQPVTFARVGGELWSAIDDKPKRGTPARVARLRANPRAALTVDRYDDDWSRLAWIQILGTVTVHDRHAQALTALVQRYPPYRARPPRGPFLQLTPERVLWWRANG